MHIRYIPNKFSYADTVEYANGYIMRGNISVIDDSNSNVDLQQTVEDSNTVGILMVPTQDISLYTSDLQNRGFLVDSAHNFQDLGGGQSGTGDEQTLLYGEFLQKCKRLACYYSYQSSPVSYHIARWICRGLSFIRKHYLSYSTTSLDSIVNIDIVLVSSKRR